MPDAAKRRILAQRRTSAARPAGRARLAHVVAIAVLALSGVAAFGIAPETTVDIPPMRTVERSLAAPDVLTVPDDPGPFWREERIRRGDTIGSLLARTGVDDPAALAFVRTNPEARPLYQLMPGRAVQVATDAQGSLVALRFRTADGDRLTVARESGALVATRAPAPETVRLALKSGEITTSLFGAADAVGLPDAVTIALAELFAGDIDFLQDLRFGDRFTVLYEVRYVDGEPVGVGRIVAAEFENRGERLSAFLWRDADGQDAWYTEDGRSTRRAFLRSPMEFSRMTSGFSLARFHPILQSWRAHRGVDYGAPSGTPVRATADGVVELAGVKGGYGNVVLLRHTGAYSTLYAHLSRFAAGVRGGKRVRQGDTIGFVGATGWATGPHLHYEFRVNDVPRNPLTIALPTAGPLPPETRAAFSAHIAPIARQFAFARELPVARFASAD